MQTTIPPIRVLFLSAWYPNKTDAIFGLFVKRHAQCITPYADVSVLYVHPDNSIKKNYEIEILTNQKLTEIIVYYKNPHVRIPLITSFIKLYRFLTAYKKGFKYVKKEFGKYDLIHANILTRTGFIAYLQRIFSKKPYIITEHWSRYLPITKTYKGFLRKWITKIVVKHASAVTTVSNNLKDAMNLHHLYNNNYHIIPNNVDTDAFAPILKKPSSIKTILHVSCFEDRSKNISGILRVLKKLSEVRSDFNCRFVGDGIDKPILEKYAKEIGLPNTVFFFEGLKEGDDLIKIYQQSDFLLMFSHFESFSIVIAEAFSCGLPVIATHVGGIPEIVNETNGILVNAKDEETLFNAIIKMLDTYYKYDKSQLHLYAVKFFDKKVIGEKYLEVYKEVLNR